MALDDPSPEPLEGVDLDPYRGERLSHCWWCTSDAPLTREHKFKRTDLTRMWDADGLDWGSDHGHRSIRSPKKSNEVRFDPSLCGRCNNERSQPFDNAYERFSDFVWHTPPAWRRRYLDMAQVYGDDWAQQNLNLARYFTKQIGCRLAQERFPVPPSLAEFMEGGSVLTDVQMVLFKSKPHQRWSRRGRRDGVDARGLWINAGLGAVSRSRSCLSVYSSAVVINYIGVFYRWELDCAGVDPFYVYRRARLHNRAHLPEI